MRFLPPALLLGGLVAALVPSGQLALGLGLAAVGFAAAAMGTRLLRACGLPAPPELAFVVGFVAFAYVVAVPTLLFGVPILWPAAVFCLCGAAAALRPGDPPAPADVLVSAAAAAFALAWSWGPAVRLARLPEDGVFRLWSDFFIHASAVAQLGDIRALGRGNPTLADIPANLYHFVSFAVPALATRLVDLPPIEACVTVWLPVGAFVLAMGMAALGRAAAGGAGAALSLALLAAFPDSATYALREGFFSVHWMLETAPTSLYALPCAMAALALLGEARRPEVWWRATALSVVLLVATILLRAHIFAWLVYPWAVAAVASAPFLGRRTKLMLILLGAVLGAAGLAVVGLGEIRSLGLARYLVLFTEMLRAIDPTTPNAAATGWLSDELGALGALLPNLALALLGFGALPLFVCLGGGWVALRRGRATPLDLVPLAALVWAVAMMTLGPTPAHGDSTEFRQRGFLLPALLLLVWSARWALLAWPGLQRPLPLAGAALAASLVTAVVAESWKLPPMPWAVPFRTMAVAPEILAGAAWLRTEAGPGSAFAFATPDPREMLTDVTTQLVGLSGVPAWLARPGIHASAGGVRAAAAGDRLAQLAAIDALPTPDAALAPLRAAGVSLYVVQGDAGPRWDAGRGAAAFRAGRLAIYRTAP